MFGGALYPYIRDYTTGLPCSAANTSGCFRDGGVPGRIPASRLYAPTLAALNIFPLPNTTGGQETQSASARGGRPGVFVSYLANVERARIDYTVKCCWDDDCWGNTLNGLLTKTTRERRSLWWLYKSYADLSGEIVEVAGSAGVDGGVAKDSNRGVLRAVFGRYRGGSGPVLIRFSGLGPTHQRAKVVAERIASSKAQALAAPARTIDGVFAIRKGLLEAVLNNLGMFDAYALTISLAAKQDPEEPNAQNVDRE